MLTRAVPPADIQGLPAAQQIIVVDAAASIYRQIYSRCSSCAATCRTWFNTRAREAALGAFGNVWRGVLAGGRRVRGTDTMEFETLSVWSVRLDVRELDNLRPLLDVFGN